jgi:valyl-tRNA synthetase
VLSDILKNWPLAVTTAKKRLEGLQNRLSNKNYVHQAPKQLVEETKQQIVTTQTLIENIEKELARFA